MAIEISRRSLLAGALLWPLAACPAGRAHTTMPQATRPQIRPTPAPVPAVVNPTPTRRVEHYPNLSEAVRSILTKDTRVLGFGEIHKSETSNLISTLEYFAREVMPVLAERNFKELVLEHLPLDERARKEIQAHQLGPFLSKWFAFHPDYCGVLRMLQQAAALGLTPHGCHPGGFLNAEIRSQKALAITRALLAQGKRVAIYMGARHNNIVPTPGEEGKSLGHVLRREIGSAYQEIDIYLPELAATFEGRDSHLLQLEDWRTLVPRAGVTLVSLPNGRRILILPRVLETIIERFPERAPACP